MTKPFGTASYKLYRTPEARKLLKHLFDVYYEIKINKPHQVAVHYHTIREELFVVISDDLIRCMLHALAAAQLITFTPPEKILPYKKDRFNYSMKIETIPPDLEVP